MFVSKILVILVFTVTLTYFDSSCLGYHLLPYSNTTLIRDRRQADCSDAFTCRMGGDCVPRSKICDGKRDCSDGSDETFAVCKDVKCPEFKFRCMYGACVKGDSRCNGLHECADGSDEDPDICKREESTPRPTTPLTAADAFACRTVGDFVLHNKICDGKRDCSDGSDETFAVCKNVKCPEFSFRCSYGACVKGDSRCNGLQECADGSDEDPDICQREKSTPRPTTPPTAADTFVCRMGGDSVLRSKMCDGKRDCSDGSDETFAVCKDVNCPKFKFRCMYGACVEGNFRCNGLQECADGSDEDPDICQGKESTPRPTTPPTVAVGSCPAINIPNGKYEILGSVYLPGAPIPNYSLGNLSCNANYALYPPHSLVSCINGNWNVPVPQCKLTCPPIISSSLEVTCLVDGNFADCSKPLVEGAVVTSKCKPFYTQSIYDNIPTAKCSKGFWSNSLIECVPACGEVVSMGVTHVVNGTSAKIGEFPWHVGLYRLENGDHKYRCGGSIIKPLVIITAAHCLTDVKGSRYPADEYYVGAGKYYSDYNSADDIFAQKRQVKEYHIPSDYKGIIWDFQADLAVVVVREAFQMTNVVQPVCMDWDSAMERHQLKPYNVGSVVGWGYVDPNVPKESAELNKLNPPFIDREQCYDEVPENFRRWLTYDKFCAGFKNGTSICRGDSGGGLVFKWNINNNDKYFVRGVVSVGPVRDKLCDNFQYTVYTRISHYLKNNFIQRIIAAID